MALSFESGESSLSVRRFTVTEGISTLWTASVLARSDDPSIDLESIAGKAASLRIASGLGHSALGGERLFAGMCVQIAQIAAEPTGLSTYQLDLRPLLWKLTQRRNHRIFQRASIPEIAEALLAEWAIPRDIKVDRAKYPRLELRVQYGESDYDFLCRMLEEAGIAFAFTDGGGQAKLLVSDTLQAGAPRGGAPIPYLHNPMEPPDSEFVVEVRVAEEVRPGAYGIHDHDFRNPALALHGEAPRAPSPEDRYEQTHYVPGAFLIEKPGKGGETPHADDRGTYRRDPQAGADRAARSLEAARTGRRAVAFRTNAIDLRPGEVFSIGSPPRADLSTLLLVTRQTIEGTVDDHAWSAVAHGVFADTPYRPPRSTPRPRAKGVQSAIVVGPAGQEIHTDEFGRVRVQFPWDRVGRRDDGSSSWIRVSDGWAGPGYGMLTIPRIGQEVLVAFLGGDPDQPVVVGRVFNVTNPAPYKLPEHKTRTAWKSDSSPLSEGINEISFEDRKGDELVYIQAQKKLRRLVKNDETSTVAGDREKVVDLSEEETTAGDRVEVTEGARKQTVSQNRVSSATGTLSRLVKKDEITQIDADGVTKVDKDLHSIVCGDRRELVEMDEHVHVKKSRSESVGARSLLVGGTDHEKMGGTFALEAGDEIRYAAVAGLVGEASAVTLKAGGNFVRIDSSGVTLLGTLVDINNGGSPGSAKASQPAAPVLPRKAMVQTTYTIEASWLDVTAYCGDAARVQALVTPAPQDGPATVEVLLASTGATIATLNTAVTAGRIGAAWVTKAPTASWRTDVIQFRVTVPSINATGTSRNTFTFRQRPVTGWTLLNVAHPSNGRFLPSHEKHDAALEADRVHYSLKLRLFGAPFGPVKQAAAKALIERVWNDGFSNKKFHRVSCGRGRACSCAFDCCKATWRLDVNFVPRGEHLAIEVIATVPPARPHQSEMNGDGGEWGDPPLSPTTTYPHETGHVLGQADEYSVGATDPTGVQPAQAPPGELNLMSTPGNQTLLNRHYRWALAFLNRNTAGDVYEIIPP
ncbi:type VI secretion system Vgr family protein [Sorangium sp. So ce1128]